MTLESELFKKLKSLNISGLTEDETKNIYLYKIWRIKQNYRLGYYILETKETFSRLGIPLKLAITFNNNHGENVRVGGYVRGQKPELEALPEFDNSFNRLTFSEIRKIAIKKNLPRFVSKYHIDDDENLIAFVGLVEESLNLLD